VARLVPLRGAGGAVGDGNEVLGGQYRRLGVQTRDGQVDGVRYGMSGVFVDLRFERCERVEKV